MPLAAVAGDGFGYPPNRASIINIEANPMAMKNLPATAMNSHGADYARGYHHVNVDPDATLQDILRPSFWAYHVNNVRVNDLVDVLTLDGGIDLQMRVIGKGIGYIEFRVLRCWTREAVESIEFTSEPDTGDDEIPDGYAVNFAPKQLWRVIMKNPHNIVSKDIRSKAEAINVAKAHAAKANAVAA